MNYGPLLFLGILFTLTSSWLGLVVVPTQQLGSLQPHVQADTGSVYPQPLPGEAAQGREVYRSLGCVTCHTQQVRRDGSGSDIARGWGKRGSVARDYLYASPALLGDVRVGPDLTNIGERAFDPQWHYSHLYQPRSTSKGSLMPSYPFLFELRQIGAAGASTNAVALTGEFAPPKGWEVVPKPQAKQLVAYLRIMKTSVDLPEAPLPKAE